MKSLKHSILVMTLLSASTLFVACEKKADTVETKAKQEVANTAQDALKKTKAISQQAKDRTENYSTDLEKLASNVPNMSEIYADGEKYMDWFAGRDGVQKTDSGLLYRVLEQGNGDKPARENIVSVHYRGTFPAGDEFDSSYKRNAPAQFPVTGVIPGWTEALLMMNEGTKLELVIPPELAYGERGAGNVIPPNQVLRFEVELLDANFRK